jgi:hypothetical protein
MGRLTAFGSRASANAARSDGHIPRTMQRVERGPAREESSVRRLAVTVYDAHAGGRSPILDGPWWLGLIIAGTVALAIVGGAHGSWVALPVVVALLVVPSCVRWAVALGRSIRAFREGFRS